MVRFTELEILQMQIAFNIIEDSYQLVDEETLDAEIKQYRRLNKSITDELAKKDPDHEKIYYLLNAINTLQNGKQQTTKAFPTEAEPENEKTNRIKRWFKKSNEKRK